jgi:hypothetical protein
MRNITLFARLKKPWESVSFETYTASSRIRDFLTSGGSVR